MQEDFPSAAVRHYEDARRLLGKGRCENAFYLSGYTAECILKSLLVSGGVEAKKFCHQLKEMRLRGLEFLAGYSYLWSRYRPRWRAALDDWSPEIRYLPPGTVDISKAAEAVDDAEMLVREILPRMILDGLISEVRR
jgi:HEPN domain-containing protein